MNELFCSFVDGVRTWRQIFNLFFISFNRQTAHIPTSFRIASQMTLNKREMTADTFLDDVLSVIDNFLAQDP